MCALDAFFTPLEQLSWSDSRQFCQDHGGYLVMIKSEEKQVCLYGWIIWGMSLCERLWMNVFAFTHRGSFIHLSRRGFICLCGLVCLTQRTRALWNGWTIPHWMEGKCWNTHYIYLHLCYFTSTLPSVLLSMNLGLWITEHLIHMVQVLDKRWAE